MAKQIKKKIKKLIKPKNAGKLLKEKKGSSAKSKKPIKKIIKAVKKNKPVKAISIKKKIKKQTSKKPLVKQHAAKKTVVKQTVKPKKIAVKPVKTPVKPIVTGKKNKKPIPSNKKTKQLVAPKKVTTNSKPPRLIKAPIEIKKTLLTISVPTITKKKEKITSRKEPKGKFILEYVVHASANILFEFLTSPSGLSEWFADDVNIRDGIYTFFWDGSQQQAKIISYKEPQFIRLKWMDKTDDSYFEFRIEVDDLTGDVSLLISDFAEDEQEMRTSRLLWDNQVKKLLQILGSY